METKEFLDLTEDSIESIYRDFGWHRPSANEDYHYYYSSDFFTLIIFPTYPIEVESELFVSRLEDHLFLYTDIRFQDIAIIENIEGFQQLIDYNDSTILTSEVIASFFASHYEKVDLTINGVSVGLSNSTYKASISLYKGGISYWMPIRGEAKQEKVQNISEILDSENHLIIDIVR